MRNIKRTDKERFDEFKKKVKLNLTNDCWEYQEYKDKDGYGRFWDGNTSIGAHRYVWELLNGEVPVGLSILHKCDNPACVNPDHLYCGTQSDNMSDKMLRRTYDTATHCHNASFYSGEVYLIRKLKAAKIPQWKIGLMFNCNQSVISRIKAQNTICRGGYRV